MGRTNNKIKMDVYSKQIAEEFGTFSKARREALGMSLRGAAAEIEITAPYLLGIERGTERPPKGKTLENLVRAYKLQGKERNKAFELEAKCRDTVSTDIVSLLNHHPNLRMMMYDLCEFREECSMDDKEIELKRAFSGVCGVVEEYLQNRRYDLFPLKYDKDADRVTVEILDEGGG